MKPVTLEWTQRALDFWVRLSPIKGIRQQSAMIRELFALLDSTMQADAVGVYRNFDSLTTRMVHSNGHGIFHGHLNPVALAPFIRDTRFHYIEAELQKQIFSSTEPYERCVMMPLKSDTLSGGLIIGWKQAPQPHSELDKFLEVIQLAMSELMQRLSIYFEIEELSTRYNAILETIPEGIVYVEDSGKSAWINGVAAKLIGLNPGYNDSFTVSQAMRSLRSRAVNQQEINARAETLFQSPNNMIQDWIWAFGRPIDQVLSIGSKPIQSSSVQGRLWVFTDTTSDFIASKTLKSLNEELERQRNIAIDQSSAKSDFLAKMSHEIRTPMNGVIGMTSLLLDTPLNTEQADFVETIRSSGETLLTLINDILDLSKIEAGKMELEESEVRLNPIIAETLSMLAPRAKEKKLGLSYTIVGDVPERVIADSLRIRQVLINLLSNAIKFTEEGSVSLTVTPAQTTEEKELRLQFSITDTGIGIPENKQELVFENFSQADSTTTRKYGGTGLGLAICQKLVSMMHGTIKLTSKVGIGSTFSFDILVKIPEPIMQAPTTLSIVADEDHAQPHIDSLRILVAEDNETNQKLIRKTLSKLGYACDLVGTGTEAVNASRNKKYDIIFMDIMMPEMDGYEATSNILKMAGDHKPVIIAMTANAFSDDKEKVLQAGMNDYLGKPFRIKEVEEKINQWKTPKAR